LDLPTGDSGLQWEAESPKVGERKGRSAHVTDPGG
jgi:hypothetical protein